MTARAPKPVENRGCHLENDRAISSPSRPALHLWLSSALLAGLLPTNSKQEGRVPFFWEAQSLQRLQGVEHKWWHTASRQTCSMRYQLIERPIQYISVDVNLFAMDAHQGSKGVETRVSRDWLTPHFIRNYPADRHPITTSQALPLIFIKTIESLEIHLLHFRSLNKHCLTVQPTPGEGLWGSKESLE